VFIKSNGVIYRVTRSPNLSQVVRRAERGPDGTISSLEVVQRTPKGGVDEWGSLLSATLSDWYSPIESAMFTKEVFNLTAAVVVDATEFGDVLMTAGLTVGQGVERPLESSAPGSDDQCGQAATLTFFMQLVETAPSTPDPTPAGSTAGGKNFSAVGCCCPDFDSAVSHELGGMSDSAGTSRGSCDYRGIWSYRRAVARNGSQPWNEVNVGDISQQNWGNPSGNDLDNGYMFLPLEDARASVSSEEWVGGVNLTALGMLEQRAFGWFHAYAASFPAEYTNRFILNRSITNTSTGLSKMPYLRDTRRSVGLGGFRLMHHNQSTAGPGGKVGVRFNDSVAFGNYRECPCVCFVHDRILALHIPAARVPAAALLILLHSPGTLSQCATGFGKCS
jgi:hypothetical protein